MKKIVLNVSLLCVASFVFAASSNEDGKDFAKNMLNTNLKQVANSVDTSQIPNYSENVPEKNLKHDQLESKAYEKLTSDSTSKENTNMIINRQQYKLDSKNDPLIKNYNNIQQGAAELITSNYTGCTNVKYGADSDLSNTTRSCGVKVELKNEFTCTSNYYNQCTNPKAGIPNTMIGSDINIVSFQANKLGFLDNGDGNFSFASSTRQAGCSWFVDEIHFEAKDASSIKKLVISALSYDDGVWIEINGEQVFSIIGNTVNPTGNWRCEQNRRWNYSTPIDLTSKVRKGTNVLKIRHVVADLGAISFNLKIDRVEP